MGRGRRKGNEAFEAALADKKYKSGVQELIRKTPVQPSDFDQKAFALLDALQERDRALEACQHLQHSLQGITVRSRISNWRAYVYTLLRGFDETVYAAMKADRGSENRRKKKAERAEAGKAALLLSEALTTKDSATTEQDEDKTLEFNQSAAEFVPGKPWSPGQSPAQVPKTSLRTEAVEFVPSFAQAAMQSRQFMMQAAAMAHAARPAIPAFRQHTASTPTSLKTTAPEFKPGQVAWTKSATEIKPLKHNAAEFVPGVSAWAGAMNLGKASKSKPKAKAGKASSSASAVEASPSQSSVHQQRNSPVSAQQALGATTSDADIAGGVTSSTMHQSTEAGRLTATKTVNAVGPISSRLAALQFRIDNLPEPRQLRGAVALPGTGKQVLALEGVLRKEECTQLLEAASLAGFCSAIEQDRAGGPTSRLVTEDSWLAEELWQRVKSEMPKVWQRRPVLGLQSQLELQYGRSQDSWTQDPGRLLLRLCVREGLGKQSSSWKQGQLVVLQTVARRGESQKDDQDESVWLSAEVRCGETPIAQDTASRSRLCSVAVVLLVGAAVAVPLLRRQR
eukprot:TRINITY_DN92337_c0_g1_i1.p1 TRINITY_DN92337_c0_g1~~TRINITY_DN92337_c0_g1_i1.p1  ORF type:complete len:578 (+),score=145.63 TRINITY_DN92337_c0_g1_i1:38-1735(+)